MQLHNVHSYGQCLPNRFPQKLATTGRQYLMKKLTCNSSHPRCIVQPEKPAMEAFLWHIMQSQWTARTCHERETSENAQNFHKQSNCMGSFVCVCVCGGGGGRMVTLKTTGAVWLIIPWELSATIYLLMAREGWLRLCRFHYVRLQHPIQQHPTKATK